MRGSERLWALELAVALMDFWVEWRGIAIAR
jgi:hypothetical protein